MMTCSILLSFILVASFYGAVVSSSDEPMKSNDIAGENPFLMRALVGKRDSFKKLRPQNPLLIYHQSIRQPAFPSGRFMMPRTISADSADGLLAVTSGGDTAHHHDIPRRLIRRNPHRNQAGRLVEAAGTSTGNAKPPASYFVWNHQLLPSFYSSKHLPAEIKNLRREQQQLYSSNNKKWKRTSDVESPWSVPDYPEDSDLMNDLEMIPSNPEQKLKDKKIYAGHFFNEQGAGDSQEFEDYYY